VLVGVLAALLAAAGATAYSVKVSVTSRALTKPLANDFLGLALEYSTIPTWVGNGSGSTNPVLAQLIRNLDPAGGISLRIGGQSTDRAWWPVPGMHEPPGVTYSVTPAWAAAAAGLAKATAAKLLLGINLEAGSTKLSRVEADQLVNRIGRRYIAALAIGNEPNLYRAIPWYRVLNGLNQPWYSHGGTPVYSRPTTWGPTAYDSEFEQTAKVLPDLPLAGPDHSNTSWFQSFATLLSSHSRLRMLTSHAYGLNNCVTNPSAPQYPSIAHLLMPYASQLMASSGLERYVGRAHADGATYRIDEMGSVTCNGHAGVSDTMASALWATDALFSAARAGVDGVNLHSFPNSANGLFDFSQSGGRWEGTVHPLYYGALMFATAAPPGSRLVQATSSDRTPLRAWSTRAGDGVVRVLLTNDSLTGSATATVTAPKSVRSGSATVERLEARSTSATTGITLGGHGFGAKTSTGTLPAAATVALQPRHGAYHVQIPPASAALLTIRPAAYGISPTH
jgi:hypothetical protein